MGKYSCEACKKKCKKEAIRLQDKYFHVACFMCKECRKPLATDGFYTKDGAHYCGADYQRLFGTKCHSCGKIVEGEVMTVLGKTYHQDCFRCSKCLKKFLPGEKATFSKNDEHWCHSCHLQHQQQEEQQQQQLKPASPVPAQVVSGFRETGASSATAVEIPTSPQSINDESLKLESPQIKVEYTEPNDFLKPESPVEQKISPNVAEIPKEDSAAKTQKPASNLPRVFGMPTNKFYNMSYLEHSNTEFKRGPSANAVTKEPAVTHYHRPNNFSYTNLRKDFKSEQGIQGYGDKKDMVLLSRRPGAQGKPLAPIERDDWPGPPEPAAAYPELLRDKTPQQPKSPHADELQQMEDEKVTKEIDELSKMTDSGAAAVILRDLKKKRAESPTLDPRNASMTPSAALELRKPRYELPIFASPSRNLDMRLRVLQQERNRKSMNDLLFAPNNFGGVVKPGHGLSVYRPGSSFDPLNGYQSVYRPGSSFDPRNGYQSDGTEIEPRPKSSAGILNSYSFDVYEDRGFGDVDPTTGLRHSSKRSTLPHGLSGRFLLENINLSSPGSKDSMSPKIYPYELLTEKNAENLVGVNRDSLERHLSRDEFETVFQMSPLDFYRLPVWQRNEAKLRVGLM